jgi:hypothetical protein
VVYNDFTIPSNPLNTLKTRISAVVPNVIATILIHAMMLMALVDFFALKYRQAKRKVPPIPLKGELSFAILFMLI